MEYRTHVKPTSSRRDLCAFFVVYLYIFLYCVFVIVYMSDQIALNYVVCIYFASPGASHLLKFLLDAFQFFRS